MADVPARFKVDLSQIRGAFGEIRRLAGGVGGGQLAGVAKGAQSVNRELAASPGHMARFSQSIGRAARVAAGLSAITVALVVLNRRFPVIGEVASKAFGAITKGGNLAVSTTMRVVATLGNLRVAIGLAAGIFTLAKAFRALRTESSNLPAPKLPGAGAMGGGGGAFRGGFAGGIAGVMGGALLRKAVAPVMAGLMAAGNFEQTEISFDVMTGGLEQAQALIKEIKDDAEKTPFTLPGLSDAAKLLLNYGSAAENVPKQLRMLGDVAAGNEEKLQSLALVFGQIQQNGRLQGQDLYQLVNAGFNPLNEIAKKTGESMASLRDRMSAGAIGFDEVEGAFIAATSAGGKFYQMNERQSKTFLGLISTLKDVAGAIQRAFGAPIMSALKPVIVEVTNFFKGAEAQAAAFGEKVAQAIDFVRAMLKTMSAGEIFLGVGKALQYGFQVAVDTLVKGVQAAIALMGDADFMGEIGKGLEIAALKFKEILLLAVAAIVESMKGILPNVTADSAAAQLKAGADLAAAQREAIEAEPRKKVGDLVERVRGEFEDARGLFGVGKNDALLQEVKDIFSKAAEEAQRLTAERTRTSKGMIPPSDGGGGGSEKPGVARGSVAGAFQQAINLIQGRTVNEVIAAEAQKSNRNQEEQNKRQKEMNDKLGVIERNTRPKTKPVTVNVVPTFGNNVA